MGALNPTDLLNSDVIRVVFLAYIISRGFLLFVLRLMEKEGEGGQKVGPGLVLGVGAGGSIEEQGVGDFPQRIIATD